MQLLLFAFLTLILSWFPWYSGRAAEVLTIGPSLAAFILVPIFGGRKELRSLLRRFIRVRAAAPVWVIALIGPAAIYLLAVGVHVLTGGDPPPFTMIRSELNLLPLYLVMVVLLPWNGPIGEEFGWRGYAQPRTQGAFGPLIASLAIGLFWGVWHLPSFFDPNNVIGAIAARFGVGLFLPIYCVGTVSNSIFMTWIYNKTRGSALIAGIVWHAGINFWAPVLLSDSSLAAARDGGTLPTIESRLYVTAIVVQAVLAMTLVIVTQARLGRAEESGAAD